MFGSTRNVILIFQNVVCDISASAVPALSNATIGSVFMVAIVFAVFSLFIFI
jgi:hypothetical protein